MAATDYVIFIGTAINQLSYNSSAGIHTLNKEAHCLQPCVLKYF